MEKSPTTGPKETVPSTQKDKNQAGLFPQELGKSGHSTQKDLALAVGVLRPKLHAALGLPTKPSKQDMTRMEQQSSLSTGCDVSVTPDE